jgi:putative membrane protein
MCWQLWGAPFGMMGGFGWIGILFTVLFLGLVAWFIALLIRRTSGPTLSYQSQTSINAAKERYAKGEISREEFEQIKKDLS